jgi:hypothetical protein
MSDLDLRTPGEKALADVALAKVLLRLTRSRSPNLFEVLDAIRPITESQPAAAASILVRHAKLQEPHNRVEWLEVASNVLKGQGMIPATEKTSLEESEKYLQGLLLEAREALKRRMRIIDSCLRTALTTLAVALIVFSVWFIVEHFKSSSDKPNESDPGKTKSTQSTKSTEPTDVHPAKPVERQDGAPSTGKSLK